MKSGIRGKFQLDWEKKGVVKRRGANRYVRNPFCLNWAQDEEGTIEKLQFGSIGKLGGIGRYVDEEIAR